MTASWGNDVIAEILPFPERQKMILPAKRSITLDKRIFSRIRPHVTNAGTEPTSITLILRHRNNNICVPLISILPPHASLPRSYPPGHEGYPIEFLNVQDIPSPSGITIQETRDSIIKKALEVSNDALLVRIDSGSFIQVNAYAVPHSQGGGTKTLDVIRTWDYVFNSPIVGSFSIDSESIEMTELSDDSLAIHEIDHSPTINPREIKLDIDVATLIAEHTSDARGVESGFGLIGLRKVKIGSDTRPVWHLPYKRNDQWLGVCADTGEVVLSYNQKDDWTIAPQAMSNK